MNKQELKHKLKELQQEFELKKKEVMKQFCDANNLYKVGDKFTDHIGTIIIEKIRYSLLYAFKITIMKEKMLNEAELLSIKRLRAKKVPYEDIAERIGISVERVKAIYKQKRK